MGKPVAFEARADERVDLAALKGKTVNGKLEVSPHSANLYGGTLAGTLSADADGNRIHVKEAVQNVALGALLRDVAQKDVLEGRGNLTLDV